VYFLVRHAFLIAFVSTLAWDVRTTVTATGWSAEFRIPFSLRFHLAQRVFERPPRLLQRHLLLRPKLQLYMLAARELWGKELAGGLYRPLGARNKRDRQPKGLVPARKLLYWDLYRQKGQDLLKDREASFRRLFGEAFARAYDEQLKQLKP